ncbi:MAG: metal-dependent hydrolase [Alcanivorax sp.]|nr:metal-dependent hydrolase [Pseudomonadota bacterium]TNC89709.1 MAG: metal-dependent hydrolase [Alcanivorax sp.]
MTAAILPVRRNLQFYLPKDKIDNWNGAGAHWTQFLNTLSLFFPAGERFFIQSVRNYRKDVVDKELKKAVSAFIGQEAFHTREHEEYNEAMVEAGIPIDQMEANVEKLLAFVQKTLPRPVQLAVTVALEHLTAMLADIVMEDDRFIKNSDPHYEALWKWHAMEETEHKGVAFDVYEETVGKGPVAYALRTSVFVLANVIFWSLFYRYYYLVMKSRDEHKNIAGWRKSFRYQFGKRGVFPSLIGDWLSYFKPGFHPWDIDNSHLLDEAEDLMRLVDDFAAKANLVPDSDSAAA